LKAGCSPAVPLEGGEAREQNERRNGTMVPYG
jgi:hypothetical protein